MSGDLCRKQTCTKTAIHYCMDDRQLLIAHRSSHRSIASYSSRIAICIYPTCTRCPVSVSPSEYCYSVWYEKLKWCGYPMVEKNWRYVYSFRQNPRTWQTDRQTDTAWRRRPRLCIASRSKNDGQWDIGFGRLSLFVTLLTLWRENAVKLWE